MSDASSRVDLAPVVVSGPSFMTALCGFVSSMVAGAALVLLIGAL